MTTADEAIAIARAPDACACLLEKHIDIVVQATPLIVRSSKGIEEDRKHLAIEIIFRLDTQSSEPVMDDHISQGCIVRAKASLQGLLRPTLHIHLQTTFLVQVGLEVIIKVQLYALVYKD